jgi:hypothetical protein
MKICIFSERFQDSKKKYRPPNSRPKISPPPLDEELGHRDHEQRRRRQFAAEGREDLLEGRDHEDHDHRDHHEGHHQHRDRVHQRRLDLALDGQRLLLVDRQAVEQRLQDAAGLAGFDQVAVQRIEVQRVLAEGRGQAGAGLDVGRMSFSSLVMRGLVLPRPTMSKDCSSGTPAFIMVASWRVKIAMSFCLIDGRRWCGAS